MKMKKNLQTKRNSNNGFTLVELIIAIAIMTILTGTITLAVIHYVEKARATVDAENCSTLKKNFLNYAIDGGFDGFMAAADGEIEVADIATYNRYSLATDGNGGFATADAVRGSVTYINFAEENTEATTAAPVEGQYYTIIGDDGREYTKKYPHEGTPTCTNSEIVNLAGDQLDVYQWWHKYQDDGYKAKHPLNEMTTYEDFLRCADPAYVVWYEKTSCDYKWEHNIEDEETKDDYEEETGEPTPERHPDDPEPTTEAPTTATTEAPTTATTEAPTATTTESPAATTTEAPSTSEIPPTPIVPGDVPVTPSEPAVEQNYYLDIAVYGDHMEIYNPADVELSQEFLASLGYDDNYEGNRNISDAAATGGFGCKTGNSSYIFRAAYVNGEYKYTIYLTGKLAKYENLFDSLGDVKAE